MSFIGPSAVYADTFRAIERHLSAFTPPIKLREHLVDNPKTVADLEATRLPTSHPDEIKVSLAAAMPMANARTFCMPSQMALGPG